MILPLARVGGWHRGSSRSGGERRAGAGPRPGAARRGARAEPDAPRLLRRAEMGPDRAGGARAAARARRASGPAWAVGVVADLLLLGRFGRRRLERREPLAAVRGRARGAAVA